jgi:uncharacterized protein YkwD
MTFALIPTAVLLTAGFHGQAPNLPVDPYDVAPGHVSIYIEEVECVTVWRGRHRRTYCRVIRRGPDTRRTPTRPAPTVRVPPPAPTVQVPPPAPLPPAPTTPVPAPRAHARVTSLTASEAKVMTLLNAMRVRLGLGTLRLDKAATRVARAHSRDMCRRRYFAHRNPDGKMPWDRLKAGGVRFRAAGENIAAGQRTALAVHQDWNDSPGHRKNRLNRRYRRMGVGVFWCAGVPYWTEVFMR